MGRKTRWITETAVMMALLIALQAITKPLGQMVTGSFVNCILAVTVLTVGLSGGITVALLSPVFAFILGIAPQIITVVPIMLGNVCYVVLLSWLAGKVTTFSWRQPAALAAAAVTKFLVLYLLVVQVICGLAKGALLGKKIGETVVLAQGMLPKLTAMFTWPQLFTALIGGAIAFLIVPTLRKALRK